MDYYVIKRIWDEIISRNNQHMKFDHICKGMRESFHRSREVQQIAESRSPQRLHGFGRLPHRIAFGLLLAIIVGGFNF